MYMTSKQCDDRWQLQSDDVFDCFEADFMKPRIDEVLVSSIESSLLTCYEFHNVLFFHRKIKFEVNKIMTFYHHGLKHF